MYDFSISDIDCTVAELPRDQEPVHITRISPEQDATWLNDVHGLTGVVSLDCERGWVVYNEHRKGVDLDVPENVQETVFYLFQNFHCFFSFCLKPQKEKNYK